MGLRFRQSFTLFPGVRLNMGKHGISASFGVPGATVNVGARGVRATVGLPGSGLSYTANLAKFGGNGSNTGGGDQDYAPQLANYYVPTGADVRQIQSAATEMLTSESLEPLRAMIIKAREQSKEVAADLADARQLATKLQGQLKWRQWALFRWACKRRIAALEIEIPATLAEVARLEEWAENSKIKIKFQTSPEAAAAWGHVVRAFEAMAACQNIWDVTAEQDVNQFAERSSATHAIHRTPVKFGFVSNDLLQFEGRALHFQNANGDDILIYPGVALIPRADGVFALVDLRDLNTSGATLPFIERNTVPGDASISHYTWAKVNKNGTPDRRFKENYQIPVCNYGELEFRTNTGLNEGYMLSNDEPVKAFARALQAYQQALRMTAVNLSNKDAVNMLE